MDDGFTQLQQAFIAGIPDRLSRMQQLYDALTERCDGTDQAPLVLLHRELHKLAGAAACYQCDAISNCAENLEMWIEEHLTEAPLAQSRLEQLQIRLDSLGQVCSHS